MRHALAICVIAVLPAAGFAAKVKSWTVQSSTQYDKATFRATVVSSEGTVRLGRELKPLAASIDATRVWAIAEDPAGNLYIATGDGGKLFKFSSNGETSVWYASPDSQILSLVSLPDGSLVAGTGPSGKIVRIDPTGNAKVIHEGADSYVWALATDTGGRVVYAATGPHGRVYKIPVGGRPEILFRAKADHVLTIAVGHDGVVYAGTDKQGLIYRVASDGKPAVLYQASQPEVSSLLATPSAIYAGTGAVQGPRERDTNRNNGAVENVVYRLGFDGSAREVLREKGAVLGLVAHQERLIVAAGSKGQLHDLSPTIRERTELSRLEHGPVQCLYRRRNGEVLLGASDPAKVYRLSEHYHADGSVISEPFDTKLVSRWGDLSWRGESPSGTRVTLAIRSGNVAEPDDSWSDWSAEMTNAHGSTPQVRPGRFVQFRATLATTNPATSPSLHAITLRYSTLNQAPEVTGIEVPTLDSLASAKDPKRYRFKWTATDANDDDLVFDLFLRKEEWKEWIKLDEGITKAEYEWDTTTFPPGSYHLKVVASDRNDNAEADALTGIRISNPFDVAHETPVVTARVAAVEDGRATLEVAAAAPKVRLASAAYSVNGGKWTSVFPVDGMFDTARESFRFRTDRLLPGSYVVVVKVRDVAGNAGSIDVTFSIKK